MSIESDADRLAILKSLGEQVRYKNKTIWAIFEKPYIEIGFERAIESNEPQIIVRDSDVTGVAHGDAVVRTVSGTEYSYTVENVQPDGDGMTILRLSE